MRRSLWVRFLALFGLQPRRRRSCSRTRTYIAIGPASEHWPMWLPQGDQIIRASWPSPGGDEAWLVRSKRTPRELCEHAELAMQGACRIVVLETTHRLATLHADNVVRWLETR